jgi:hypothetical protein
MGIGLNAAKAINANLFRWYRFFVTLVGVRTTGAALQDRRQFDSEF